MANEDWRPSQVLYFTCGVDVCDTGVHFCDHSQTYRTCVPCARVSHHCFTVLQQYNCTWFCMDNWKQHQMLKCTSDVTTDVYFWLFVMLLTLFVVVVCLLATKKIKFTFSCSSCFNSDQNIQGNASHDNNYNPVPTKNGDDPSSNFSNQEQNKDVVDALNKQCTSTNQACVLNEAFQNGRSSTGNHANTIRTAVSVKLPAIHNTTNTRHHVQTGVKRPPYGELPTPYSGYGSERAMSSSIFYENQ